MLTIDQITNKLFCGDSIEIMKQIPDKSINLILCDPPYGVNLKYDIYVDNEQNWDTLFLSFLPEAKRISQMVIMPCCRIAKLSFIYKNHPPDWIICWYKGSPGHRSFIGFNDWEPHLVYGKNKGICMHDYFQIRNNEKMGNYGHPCPKPLGWANWIIERATKENDLVLDCFAGSGTTLLTAKQLNRKWCGIELSPDYCEIIKKRLQNE